MREQLKEFEFVWLFFKWIGRNLIDWIARGVAVSAIGFLLSFGQSCGSLANNEDF
tara:strand:- start:105 stop:269 length:165 start_codon:yes stop_codon:yes gene_type:complete